MTLDPIGYSVARFHATKALNDKILPRASMDWEDAYQIGVEFIITNKEKPRAYIEKVLPFHIRKEAAKMWVSPGDYIKYKAKKNGTGVLWGEFSLEVVQSEHGACWEDWLDGLGCYTEYDESEVSVFTIPPDQATKILQEIRAQQRAMNDKGISFAKTRNKWHVQVVIMGRVQFVGQFHSIDKARAAKAKFLEDFRDTVLDAVSNT